MTTKNGWKCLMEGTCAERNTLQGSTSTYLAIGLYSENAPPSDVADRINASFAILSIVGLAQRQAKQIAEADK